MDSMKELGFIGESENRTFDEAITWFRQLDG